MTPAALFAGARRCGLLSTASGPPGSSVDVLCPQHGGNKPRLAHTRLEPSVARMSTRCTPGCVLPGGATGSLGCLGDWCGGAAIFVQRRTRPRERIDWNVSRTMPASFVEEAVRRGQGQREDGGREHGCLCLRRRLFIRHA